MESRAVDRSVQSKDVVPISGTPADSGQTPGAHPSMGASVRWASRRGAHRFFAPGGAGSRLLDLRVLHAARGRAFRFDPYGIALVRRWTFAAAADYAAGRLRPLDQADPCGSRAASPLRIEWPHGVAA